MTVADQVRAQRMALAEANSNHRYQAAHDQLGAVAQAHNIGVHYQPTLRNDGISMADAARKNAEARESAKIKQMMEPCPTGYFRNEKAECVVVVQQTPGLPISTEFKGPTISYNLPTTSFDQAMRRPTVMPDASVVSTLQGLGFDLEMITCEQLLAEAARLESALADPNNCEILKKTRNGVILASACRKTIQEVRTKACRLPASPPGTTFKPLAPPAYDAGKWTAATPNAAGSVVVKPPFVNRPAVTFPTQFAGLGYSASNAAVAAAAKDAGRRNVLFANIRKCFDALARLKARYPNASTCKLPSMPWGGKPVPPPILPPVPPGDKPVVLPRDGNVPDAPPPVIPPPAPALPTTTPTAEPAMEEEKSFIKKYPWLLLVVGGAAWYYFGKK